MKTLHFILFLLTGALILSGVAFYNGYPLLASDSCGYINQGFEHFVGKFRLYIYGFFVRHTSMQESLWLVVFAQNMLLGYVLYRFMHTFFKGIPNYLTIISVFVIMVAFTGISWYSSQIMTDIFTGIAALIALILLFSQRIRPAELIWLAILFLFAIQTHKSHYLIFSAFIAATGILGWISGYFRQKLFSLKHYLILLSLVVFNWFFTPLINYAVEGQWAMKSKSHIFITGRLIETGMLQRVLDDACPQKDYFLCPYKDELPHTKRKFLWHPDSPLAKTGGWDAHKEGYRAIIRESLSKPEYLLAHAKDFFVTTVRQLMHTDVGKLLVNQIKNNQCHKPVKKFFKHEYPQFATSKENSNDLSFTSINTRRFYMQLLSVLALLYAFSPNGRRIHHKKVLLMGGLLLLFLLSNAAFTAPLAGISTRYQGRVSWLLPLLALTVLYNTAMFYFQRYRQTRQASGS